MTKYLYTFTVGVLSTVMINSSYAQDIHFSQFYENAILRNPALTGIFSGDYKASVNYKRQWSEISVPFQTVIVSAESRITVNEDADDCFSFGVTASYDKAGSISFNSLQVYPAINYNKALDDKHKSFLSGGFTAGYIQRSFDPSKMTFTSEFFTGSSGENITSSKLTYFDVGAGVSLNSSLGEFNNITYYVGAAAYHLNKPKAAFNPQEAFIRLDTKWNGTLGVLYLVNNQVSVTFHANYSRQGKYQEIIAGGLVSWKSLDAMMNKNFAIYGGLFYRYKDALIPTVKLDYKTHSFTMSYDINNSSLKTASNRQGGLELTISTRGILTKGLWAQDKTKCPRFEDMLNPIIE
jgi:type IX secretion system PorP/SprF family membrane protein